MTLLTDALQYWTEERARTVMEERKKQVVSGPGHICTPADTTNPYYPFANSVYPYASLLKSLTHEPWSTILAQAPADLVPVDPLAPSRFRPNGLQIWDATVGIPAASIRQPHVICTRMVPGVRNSNTFWTQTLIPALTRVGPLGPGGEFLRPKGPFILDLVHDPLGWRMLEGAHALAHRVGETKPREHKKTMYYAGRTHFHTQRFLAQMAVCKLYGLPFDVWCLDEGKQGEPDIVQYGIEIKSSSYFRTPILKVPVFNGEAPRPDETIAFIDVGVYIEPHPYGFTMETDKWKEVNRWSCSPTIVVIAGWELVDVVTHQTLCATNPDDPGEPVCYGMSPLDLQPPDTFFAYLRYATMHRGMPKVDNQRYWYVEDWLNSKDYDNAVMEAPPLPCYDCLRVNMRAEGAPQRPQGRPPEPRDAKQLERIREGKLKVKPAEQAWIDWETDLKRVLAIIEKATVYYEGRLYGGTEAIRRRKQRRIEYKKRLLELRAIQRVTDKMAKAIRDGWPSLIPELKRQRDELILAANKRMVVVNANSGD